MTLPAQIRFRARARGVHKPGVMNKTEADYAALLELRKRAGGDIDWYAFEAITLKLADALRLTPDFFVMRADGVLELHEVKGRKKVDGRDVAWITEDARIKLKVAVEKFPFRFLVAFPERGGGWNVKEL